MRHRDLVKSQLFRAARAPVDIRLEVTCFMASVLERQEASDVYGFLAMTIICDCGRSIWSRW